MRKRSLPSGRKYRLRRSETLFAAASEEINEVIGRMDRTYDNDREYAFETGLLARLLLSAVIEGDRCDTAAFQIDAHPRVWPEDMAPIWKDRLEYLEEKLQGFPCGTAGGKSPACDLRSVPCVRRKQAGDLSAECPDGRRQDAQLPAVCAGACNVFPEKPVDLHFSAAVDPGTECSRHPSVCRRRQPDPGASFQRCADRACAGRAGRAGASGAKLECADHHHDTGPTAEHTVRWKNDGDPSLSGSLQQCDRY